MATFTSLKYERDNRLTFTINDAELSIVNACRRIIISEIPTVAFYFDATDIEHNDVKIKKNSCVLHNEFLSHRISLVPLYFDENEVNEFDAKKFKFVLNKQNRGYEIMDVTTKDFEIVDDNGEKYPLSFKEKVLPKNAITGDNILLTKLKPNLYDDVSPPRGEMVEIECFPTIGNGMKHARWSPVCLCSYNNAVDDEVASKRFDEVVREHEAENNTRITKAERETMKKRFDTLEVFRCFKKNKYDEANAFDFRIESESRLRPAYLFFKSLKMLAEKVHNFSENITNKKEDIVKVVLLSGVEDFYQVEIRNENHTLLNVLQSLMYNICFREKKPTANPLEYIGYYQPHPLDDLMVLKLRLKKLDDTPVNTAYVSGLLVDLANTIEGRIKRYIKSWLELSYADLKDIKEVVEYKDTL
jgi:DNA-directed RNA polymerase alpha subunit